MKTQEAIERAHQQGRTALIGYLPAGFPDLQTSIDAALVLAHNGCDIIEIGLPYSDPVMDGPVIQAASEQALERGFRVKDIFAVVEAVTSGSDAAVVVMSYWNPILRYGVDNFARDLAKAGGAGIITPDLIPDEASEWLAAASANGLDRIFLAAPTSSDERLTRIAEDSQGFVYGVSLMGVTGAREALSNRAREVVRRTRDAGARHVCVGIGVSKPEHVREIGEYASGAIVGTALVKALADDGVEGLRDVVTQLAQGTRREDTRPESAVHHSTLPESTEG